MKTINLLSESKCTQILDICSSIKFEKSLVVDNSHNVSLSARRKSHTIVLDIESINILLFELQLSCENYILKDWGIKLNQWTAPSINRYKKGEYYRAHTDSNRIDMNYRAFSCVTFLNDDFEGGELYFPLKNKIFVPKTGTSVLFSSDEVHCSKVIKKGTKYSLVQWLLYPEFII